MRSPVSIVRFLVVVILAWPLIGRAQAPSWRGNYFGLLEGESFETTGTVKVVLSAGGRGTVSVKLGAKPPRGFAVEVDPESGDLLQRRAGSPDLTFSLHLLSPSDGTPRVEGEISAGEVTLEVVATKVSAPPADETLARGRYNFVLGEAEESDAGAGSVVIDRQGAVRGTVRLADGRPVSLGGHLDANGRWPLYAAVSNGRATLIGYVGFEAAEDTDCTGSLCLHHRLMAANDRVLTLIGSAYERADALVPRAGQVRGATVSVWPDGEGELAFASTLKPSGAFAPATLGDARLQLSLAPATGWLTGKVQRADGSKLSLFGVVVPSKLAAGGFLAGAVGGTFHLVLDGATVTSGGSLGASTITIGGGLIKTGPGSLTITGNPSGSNAPLIFTPTVILDPILPINTTTVTYSGAGFTGIGVSNLIVPILIAADHVDSIFVTNEEGDTIALGDAADGQIVFLGGQRYRVVFATQNGAILLQPAPL